MENDVIKKLETDDYVFTVYQDDGAHYIWDELWEGVAFTSNHKDYRNEGTLRDGMISVPLYALIHGCISVSLTPFNCPWDSGVLGEIHFLPGEFGEDNQGLNGFVTRMNALLNNEIYGFVLSKKTYCPCCTRDDLEDVDSCFSFYGYENFNSMVKCMLEHCHISDKDREELYKELDQ